MKTNSQIVNPQISPVIQNEVVGIPPLVKEGTLGKYVFLYDYETTIYNTEATTIMSTAPVGGKINLPKGSFYTLKYSKGDVVNIIDFKKNKNDKGVSIVDTNGLMIKTPFYVKPIGGVNGFSPTITINNNDGWLLKVAESKPLTAKFGVNFGKNLNPKMTPVIDNPATPTDSNTKPIVTNGLEDDKSTGFFSNKNNLIMVVVALVGGYLLLSNKDE